MNLGRYHPTLREPGANLKIRQAILRVSPTTRQAEDPKKVEDGVALDSISADGRDHLPDLFGILMLALEEP